MKRFFLMMAVNIGVMIMISIVLKLIGFETYFEAGGGINYESLMVFCLVWGMGGAFISLMISKQIAKWTMGLHMIDGSSGIEEQRLMQTVHRIAQAAGLSKNPEVAIYNSPEVNAFATGPSRSNSLVAVSTGLLSHMNKDEVEGVLAHEVSHIANGDMVTMTLVQGIINAFVLFFAKAIAWAAAQALRGDEEEGPSFWVAFAIEIALQIVFGIIGSIVVSWFSRQREYRADSGAAKLVGSSKMIAALERLKVNAFPEEVHHGSEAIASMKISGKPRNWAKLWATHPDLDDRISALRKS